MSPASPTTKTPPKGKTKCPTITTPCTCPNCIPPAPTETYICDNCPLGCDKCIPSTGVNVLDVEVFVRDALTILFGYDEGTKLMARVDHLRLEEVGTLIEKPDDDIHGDPPCVVCPH